MLRGRRGVLAESAIGAPSLLRAALLSTTLGWLSACNPQSGFESAADGIDPKAKSYVDGPGSRLASGPYDRVSVDLDVDDQMHVLARRRDDDDQSLTVFGLNMQTGCTIAPVARIWLPPKPDARPRRLLPYLDALDASGAATLHFTNVECQTEAYSLSSVYGLIGKIYDSEDVGLDAGFVVQVGSSLVLADPWNASTTVIVSDFRRWTQVGTVGGPYVVWGDSQVIVLGADLQELGRFGNHVTAVSQTTQYSAFLVQDDDGLHSLLPTSDPTNPALYDFALLDAHACGLPSTPSQLGWAFMHSPCDDPHLVAEQVPPVAGVERRSFEAQVDFDAAIAMNAPQFSTDATRIGAAFLSDVDPGTGLGNLFVTQETGDPVFLGGNAPLFAGLINDPDSAWAGYAVVDAPGGMGRMIHWNWDGSTETMAENVELGAYVSGFLTNYDGRSGDLAVLDRDGLHVVESGVPDFDAMVYSSTYQWELHLEHYDGVRGDLMFAKEPALAGAFAVAASGVPRNEYRDLGLYLSLDGFGYVGNYDERARVGTLFVQNLSLGSTMTVASQVADFTPTFYPFPGLLYAVPSGDGAGIWFARAK